MNQLGRNDPCHCGSGKKYKKCCQSADAQIHSSELQAVNQQNADDRRAHYEEALVEIIKLENPDAELSPEFIAMYDWRYQYRTGLDDMHPFSDPLDNETDFAKLIEIARKYEWADYYTQAEELYSNWVALSD